MLVAYEEPVKRSETLMFFNLALARYKFVLTLWLINLAMIALPLFVVRLWEISMSWGTTATSSALASLELPLQRMPCTSKEFFRVYCSKRSCRSYNSEIFSCCSSSRFVTATSSFSADARSLVAFASASFRVANSDCCFCTVDFSSTG